MITLIKNFKYAVIALAALALVQPASVDAQEKTRNVAGTVWLGEETVTGTSTKVAFIFEVGGKAIMIDQVTPNDVKGSWKQDGDQVTITFGNCVYRGRVEGNRIAGTAQMTTGTGSGWNFAVNFMPAAPKR